MAETLPFKKYSTLAAFSFLFGLVFSMTGILYAMVGKVSRYSDPQVILVSCSLIGLGFVLTLVGVNFGGMKQKLNRSTSFIAGVLLSFAGLAIFFISFPGGWFYPRVAYVLISYSLGIFLLLVNIFVNYYTGLLMPSDYHEDEKAYDGEYTEESSKQILIKDSSVLATFAGILLTNLLPVHPESSSYREDEKNIEPLVSMQDTGGEMNIREVEDTENVIEQNKGDSGDSMKVEEDTIIGDSPEIEEPEEVKESPMEEENAEEKPASTEDKPEADMPFADFLSMKKTNINADDTMRQAARKLLMFNFGSMIEHERGTKVGKDIEELHDMRVAAMRMRSGVEVLERYLNMDEMSSHYKNIKFTRKVLGTVRDLDVFLEKIEHYLAEQPPEKKARNGSAYRFHIDRKSKESW